MNDGGGISVLIDIGELMPEIGFPGLHLPQFPPPGGPDRREMPSGN